MLMLPALLWVDWWDTTPMKKHRTMHAPSPDSREPQIFALTYENFLALTKISEARMRSAPHASDQGTGNNAPTRHAPLPTRPTR